MLTAALARVFLAGEPTVEEIVARGDEMLGRHWRWLRPLARRYLKTYSDQTRPRYREVVLFLQHDRGFRRASLKYANELIVRQPLTEPQQMQPAAAARRWNVPEIESAKLLAAWFGLTSGELAWFADLKGLERKGKTIEQWKHYHYRIFTKRSGNVRVIESPKPRLKELQRQILTLLLNEIPLHPAVHGFRAGRSIKTFVAPHVGQLVILRMDLRNFFPSISRSRVQALFRTAGYPESVADLLGGICTNATPRDVWKNLLFDIDPIQLRETRNLYGEPHLPQGAPTSPALANLCSYRLDCRLAGLATSARAQYTRYADDLAFSGGEEFAQCVKRFSTHVAAIVSEEGFAVNYRKTRIMRQGVRQQLTGLVVNKRMNIMRVDFDRLKAILTNCVHFGPEGQNREGHPNFREYLEGRIAFVEMINAEKAKRLRKVWEQIVWK